MPTTPLPGTRAPTLDVPLVGGGRFVLADHRPRAFTAVFVHRGRHSSSCAAHLRELHGLLDRYDEVGVDPVAVSMDDAAAAAALVDELALDGLRVAHDLDVATARAWGLYLSRADREGEPALWSEPAIVLVRPGGMLYAAAVCSNPWGRPSPADLIERVDADLARTEPARGTVA